MGHDRLSLRGFSAWITVDGEPLPVYQEDTVDTTCSAWIPSSAGQNFSVWWKDDSKSRIATSGHIFIDGRDVASAISRPGRTKPVERTGAKTSARRLRPFRFAVLKLTGMLLCNDDTVASVHDANLHDMGIIKIEISRVKLGDEVPFKGYEAQDHGVVHERAKKLGAHCTAYGPSMRAESSRTVAVSTAPYDPDTPGPYVTFLFRYRSKDLLRANGVISNGDRKRHSPESDDEVIEISDSESDHKKPKSPAKKRVRTDADGPSSEAPGSEVKVSSDVDMVEESAIEQRNVASGSEGVSGPLGEIENVQEAPCDDTEMASSELGLGAPSLLQSEPEHVATSPAVEESQTQADPYPELGFGAPAALLRDGNDEVATNAPIGDVSQEPHAEESQGEVDAAI